MKKFLSILLVGTMILSFAACVESGGKDDSGDKVKNASASENKIVEEADLYADYREPIEMYFKAVFNADVEAFLNGCVDDYTYSLESVEEQKEIVSEFLPRVQAEFIASLDENGVQYDPNNIYESIINDFEIVGTEVNSRGNLRVYIDIDTTCPEWFDKNAPVPKGDNGEFFVLTETDGEYKVIWAPSTEE